ncbi:unnamed protein product [Mytilus edulis]|uniref:DDE-1 domain-containing protein n=1 Tax=Mytilus edulis TaxID=6550 RepID=A0A8S3QY44_MYTED|nr:unnamed protein product [Mytilus edulis]
MKRQRRHVILLIDNCSAHPESAGAGLQHVMLKFLPPNTTSIIQPRDQVVSLHLPSSTASRKVASLNLTTTYKSRVKIIQLLTPPEMIDAEFEQFVDMDLDLPATGMPFLEDICGTILAVRAESRGDIEPADSGDEEIHPAVRPTSLDLLNALSTIRQGLEFSNVSEYSKYYKVEDQVNNLLQSLKRQ